MNGIEDCYPLRIERFYTRLRHHVPLSDKNSDTSVGLMSVTHVYWKLTWDFLSCSFCIDKGLDNFIDFTLFEADSDLFACFIIGDADCRHYVCICPEI